MNNYINYDCIVIGGGITGSALAYELVKHKLRVLLLEKNNFSNNATTYSYGGLAYWSGTNDVISSLFSEGFEIYRQLEDELEQSIEFREIDLLLTIDTHEHPQDLLSKYNNCSILPQLLDIESACQLEPLLNPQAISGALKLPHGHVHPGKLCLGYQAAFKRLGGEICHERVTQFLHQHNHVQGVNTPLRKYYSSHTVVCAGGLSRSLLQSLGISLKVYFTHAVVLKVPPQKQNLKLNTLVMPATLKRLALESRVTQAESEFLWDNSSPESLASVVDLGAVQFLDGSFYLGQASHIITDPHTMSDLNWSQEKILAGIRRILPSLGQLPVTKHQCLVAFSSDPHHPKVGRISDWSGLSVFSGFTSTMLLAPPLARRWAAGLVQGTNEASL